MAAPKPQPPQTTTNQSPTAQELRIARSNLKELLDAICNFHSDDQVNGLAIWANLFILIRYFVDAAGIAERIYELSKTPKGKARVNKLFQLGYEGNREEICRRLHQFQLPGKAAEKAKKQFMDWCHDLGPQPTICKRNQQFRHWLHVIADEILPPEPINQAPWLACSEDLDGFVPAKALSDACNLTLPEISKLCHAGAIRCHKPAKNRLLVHAADFIRFLAQRNAVTSDPDSST